jgi:hypothetical protein
MPHRRKEKFVLAGLDLQEFLIEREALPLFSTILALLWKMDDTNPTWLVGIEHLISQTTDPDQFAYLLATEHYGTPNPRELVKIVHMVENLPQFKIVLEECHKREAKRWMLTLPK